MLPCTELRRAPFIYLGRALSSTGTLFREQLALALDTPSVSALRSVLSDDAMTRNHDRDAIVSNRIGDGTYRSRSSDRVGRVAGRSCFFVSNMPQSHAALP